MVQNQFGTSIVNTKGKGDPLSMDIYNDILIKNYKDHELEKFNDEGEPIFHLKGFEYIMELKYGINDNFK